MLKNFIIVIFSQKKTLNYTSIESISSSIKLTARQSLCCIMVVENMKAPASANEKGIAAGHVPNLAVLFPFLCRSRAQSSLVEVCVCVGGGEGDRQRDTEREIFR